MCSFHLVGKTVLSKAACEYLSRGLLTIIVSFIFLESTHTIEWVNKQISKQFNKGWTFVLLLQNKSHQSELVC